MTLYSNHRASTLRKQHFIAIWKKLKQLKWTPTPRHSEQWLVAHNPSEEVDLFRRQQSAAEQFSVVDLYSKCQFSHCRSDLVQSDKADKKHKKNNMYYAIILSNHCLVSLFLCLHSHMHPWTHTAAKITWSIGSTMTQIWCPIYPLNFITRDINNWSTGLISRQPSWGCKLTQYSYY